MTQPPTSRPPHRLGYEIPDPKRQVGNSIIWQIAGGMGAAVLSVVVCAMAVEFSVGHNRDIMVILGAVAIIAVLVVVLLMLEIKWRWAGFAIGLSIALSLIGLGAAIAIALFGLR